MKEEKVINGRAAMTAETIQKIVAGEIKLNLPGAGQPNRHAKKILTKGIRQAKHKKPIRV